MSSLRKIAELKKARILADAQARAAQVDQDMEKLEQLAEKYGLTVSEPTESASTELLPLAHEDDEAAPVQPAMNGNGSTIAPIFSVVSEALQGATDASMTKRARIAAEAYIRARKRPVPLAELDRALSAHGIQFESDMPRNTLSAILGQADNLYSISRDQGWWIKDLPLPEIRRRLLS